jgi:hypothetical protein
MARMGEGNKYLKKKQKKTIVTFKGQINFTIDFVNQLFCFIKLKRAIKLPPPIRRCL